MPDILMEFDWGYIYLRDDGRIGIAIKVGRDDALADVSFTDLLGVASEVGKRYLADRNDLRARRTRRHPASTPCQGEAGRGEEGE